MGDEENGCSGIFAHAQIIYSPVFFMFMIFKFCLPIWSLLAVLEPLPTGISYAEILATSHSGVNINLNHHILIISHDLVYVYISFMIAQSLSGACIGHSSVGSPYRVLRSYVFDDNADVLGGRQYDGGRSSLSSRRHSTNSDHSEFSTRHIFSGGSSGGSGSRHHQHMLPTIYLPGHGHILPPAPRPPVHEWTNPRDYWRSRQRVNSSGQLAPIRNPSLSMISEEHINSMSGATAHNLPPDDPHRTSTPIDKDKKQQQLETEPTLLVDVHCSSSSSSDSSSSMMTHDQVDHNS